MPITRRTLLTSIAAAPIASALPRAAFAAYPEHPVRLIVPFAAGGNADFVARVVSEGMSKLIGQQIVVEYRAGAGGSLGATEVAKAAPNGYTLLTGSNGPLTVNPFVQAKLGYDSLKDFTAVGLANLVAHSLVVPGSSPVKSLAELIALSKTKTVTIGTSGAGSATHLTLARFNAQMGTNFVHVPYRGGGAMMPDLLGGNISGAMTEFSIVLAQHKAGKVRVIAIASAKRSPLAPDVPTMIEGGAKDFTAASYVGIVAPAKTPPEIVATLEKALIATVSSKATQDKFLAVGAELVPDALMTSKGFAAYIKQEYEHSREAAKLAGLTPK